MCKVKKKKNPNQPYRYRYTTNLLKNKEKAKRIPLTTCPECVSLPDHGAELDVGVEHDLGHCAGPETGGEGEPQRHAPVADIRRRLQ